MKILVKSKIKVKKKVHKQNKITIKEQFYKAK